MFQRSSVMLAAVAKQAASVMALMRVHNVRSFASKFHQLQFERAVQPRKQRYTMRYPHHSKRETQRRWLQGAHENQLASHKPGTVQPRHIFGGGL